MLLGVDGTADVALVLVHGLIFGVEVELGFVGGVFGVVALVLLWDHLSLGVKAVQPLGSVVEQHEECNENK